MKLGDKPISEMTLEERIEAIQTLQNEREALRAEGVKKFKEKQTERKVKAAKADIVSTNAEALRLLGL